VIRFATQSDIPGRTLPRFALEARAARRGAVDSGAVGRRRTCGRSMRSGAACSHGDKRDPLKPATC
jgi:hypothetical protein